ncbi:MAG: phage replisome organizer N-terminal domain-containing protein [Deltaproteobacteria bacterium]|jgi:hypothetical protein|nr:phage replisome organizer N-terminal domain-containing protein [Deltaproteobacteria bacterium]MCL5880523.1 phage replisome organizer N-terminal domain-containing protein [Deltaproteobacteria bacterium]
MDILKDVDDNIDIDVPKHIRIPLDFFKMPEIRALDNYPEKDKLVVAWLKLVIFTAKLDNDGKLQVKGAISKKANVLHPRNHMYPLSVSIIMGLTKTEEQEFAMKAVDIFLDLGLLGRNDNPKDPYLFIKNWENYKSIKPGKKTEWTKEKVEGILKESGYNMSKAARTVGIAKQYISFLAKKFGIEKPER